MSASFLYFSRHLESYVTEQLTIPANSAEIELRFTENFRPDTLALYGLAPYVTAEDDGQLQIRISNGVQTKIFNVTALDLVGESSSIAIIEGLGFFAQQSSYTVKVETSRELLFENWSCILGEYKQFSCGIKDPNLQKLKRKSFGHRNGLTTQIELVGVSKSDKEELLENYYHVSAANSIGEGLLIKQPSGNLFSGDYFLGDLITFNATERARQTFNITIELQSR